MEKLIEALRNNKNSILYFYNNSCGHCKKLKTKMNLLENNNPKAFFQFNTHEHTDISDAFEIDFVPALIVVENKKYKKLEGYNEIKKFYGNAINKLPDNKRSL